MHSAVIFNADAVLLEATCSSCCVRGTNSELPCIYYEIPKRASVFCARHPTNATRARNKRVEVIISLAEPRIPPCRSFAASEIGSYLLISVLLFRANGQDPRDYLCFATWRPKRVKSTRTPSATCYGLCSRLDRASRSSSHPDEKKNRPPSKR